MLPPITQDVLLFLAGITMIVLIVIVVLVVAIVTAQKQGHKQAASTAATIIEAFTNSPILVSLAEYAGKNASPEFAGKVLASLQYSEKMAPNAEADRLAEALTVAWRMITDGRANTAEERAELYRLMFGKEPPSVASGQHISVNG